MSQEQPDPDSGSRQHQIPQEFHINTGTAGMIATVTRVVAGLSTDKALTLFVAGAFGWLLFSTMQQANLDKTVTARMYEDSRERDRRHCSDREDKIARDRDTEAASLRLWYSNEMEKSRRFQLDEADKATKLQIAENEKTRAVLGELSRVINKKFPQSE